MTVPMITLTTSQLLGRNVQHIPVKHMHLSCHTHKHKIVSNKMIIWINFDIYSEYFASYISIIFNEP